MSENNKYGELLKNFEVLIGGKSNIASLTHCVTRIRATVKDKNLVKEEEFRKLPGVMSTIWSGSQFQLVIGNNVEYVYDDLCKELGMAKEAAIDENLDDQPKKKPHEVVMDSIISIIVQLVPMFIGGGIARGLLTAAANFGWIDASSPTYAIIYGLSWAFMYFAPIVVAAVAANKFKCNQVISMALGAALLYPSVVAALAVEGGATLFGLPVKNVDYSSTIFPIIMAVAFQAFLEKRLKKNIKNKNIAGILVPFLTLIIPGILLFVVFGPIGSYIGDLLSKVYYGLLAFSPLLCGGLMGLLWQVLVMLGIHSSFMPILINELSTSGLSTFCGIISSSVWTQTVAPLGVALKTKNSKLRSECLSIFASGVMGSVSEPAMYGINLRFKKPYIIAVIGGGIGGAIAGALGSYSVGLAQLSVYNWATYITSGLWKILLAVGVASVFTIVCTYLFGYDDSMLKDNQ